MKKIRLLPLIALTCLSLTIPGFAQKKPSVTLSAERLYFSPNKDGIQDEFVFNIQTKKVKKILSWELQIKDSGGSTRKTISEGKEPSGPLVWNGLDDFGAICAEDVYQVSLKIWDEKREIISAAPLRVVLDMTPPTVSLTCADKSIGIKDGIFSPTTFYFSAVDLSGIAYWRLQLMDQNRQEIYSVSPTTGLPASWFFSESKKFDISPKKVTGILYVGDCAGNNASSPPLELQVSGYSVENKVENKAEVSSAHPAPKQMHQEQKIEGPILQITAIISIADLFGSDADRQSQLLPQASTALDPLVKMILETPNSRATILGHVDKKKNVQESKFLSSYFAWRVFSYFVKEKGIEKKRISVRGLSADVPIADNFTAIGRTRNRRIEIQFFLPVK